MGTLMRLISALIDGISDRSDTARFAPAKALPTTAKPKQIGTSSKSAGGADRSWNRESTDPDASLSEEDLLAYPHSATAATGKRISVPGASLLDQTIHEEDSY